jgi:peptide/nickel transport system substrate-binding protein
MKMNKIITSLGVFALVLGLSACSGSTPAPTAGTPADTLVVGVLDKVISVDPAGSYDMGSKTVQDQVFEKLFNYNYSSTTPEPALAASSTFSKDGKDFIVTLKPGLTFANGNPLTSSDVKFSFDRILKINDPNGPASMLDSLKEVKVTDDLTVDFVLSNAFDSTFKQVLAANPGPIVDEDTFSPDKTMEDSEVVATNGFSGQYTIVPDSYTKNESYSLEANPTYQGLLGAPSLSKVDVRYYTQASNLVLDLQGGKIDVVFNGITPADGAALATDPNIKETKADGGRFDFLSFNLAIQPYGSSQTDADTTKALAIREAVANIIDRQEIATEVFKDSYAPVYSLVGGGLKGQVETYKTSFGDGAGGPDTGKAAEVLKKAGVKLPVEINIQYNPDHYTAASTEEYNHIKSQLEATNLFTVTLGTTEWTQYQKDRVNNKETGADGKYQAYQLGWFNDYPDADNFLRPFFGSTNFIQQSYDNEKVLELLSKEPGIQDETKRIQSLEEIQKLVTADIPIIPIVQGESIAYTQSNVLGAEKIVDALQSYRFGALSK